MRRKRRREGGFTLLEVMIAVAILAVTLVTLLSIVTNNMRATNHAKMTTAATFLDYIELGRVSRDWLAVFAPLMKPMTAPVGDLVGKTAPANPAPAAPHGAALVSTAMPIPAAGIMR